MYVEMRAHRHAGRRKAICFVCITNFSSSEVTTGNLVWWTCHKKAWSVCGQDGRVTVCMCSVLSLNNVPVLHVSFMILFLYSGGKWADVLRIQCSIKYLLPCHPAVTTSSGMLVLGFHGPRLACISLHLVCLYVILATTCNLDRLLTLKHQGCCHISLVN